MSRYTKIVLSVVAIIIVLFYIFNQKGSNYLIYDIKTGKGVIKANLLKLMFKNNYEVGEEYLIIRNKTQKKLRQWKIEENDSIRICYKIIDKEIEALGDYEYYIFNKQNNSTSLLKIDMQVFPDSTSQINILTLQNNELISQKGKIKLNILMGYNDRGLSILENIFKGNIDKFITLDETEQKRNLTKKEIADFVKF